MSRNVNKKFAKFGRKCKILVILILFAIVIGIGAYFVPFLQYINWIAVLVILVVFILAILNISKAAKALNNDKLRGFRTKMILALIFIWIALILISLGIAAIIERATAPEAGTPEAVNIFVTFGILILVGLILLIISAILQILAWGNLKRFFKNNMRMFPKDIGKKAKTGASLCQIGSILILTFILAILGFILVIIGLLKLSKLKNLK